MARGLETYAEELHRIVDFTMSDIESLTNIFIVLSKSDIVPMEYLPEAIIKDLDKNVETFGEFFAKELKELTNGS